MGAVAAPPVTLGTRLRQGARVRVLAMRPAGVPILQTAAGAGLSWFVAHDLLDHERAFFAPIAAVIVLGIAPGHRTRGAVEMVFGVSLGILVGDALIGQIGSGPLQVALVVVLAMAAAVLAGGTPLLVGQAAASAVLVATTVPPPDGLEPSRGVDALVGGAIGLAMLVIVPRRPLVHAGLAARAVLAEAAAAVDATATALAQRDTGRARRALQQARETDAVLAAFHAALDQAAEVAQLVPTQRRARGGVERYRTALLHVDYAVRNVRVLARAAVRAVEVEPAIAEDVHAALHDLARALRALARELADEGAQPEAERLALGAVARASAAIAGGASLSVSVLVGQARAVTTDILCALGLDPVEAVERVRAAAEDAPTAPRDR